MRVRVGVEVSSPLKPRSRIIKVESLGVPYVRVGVEVSSPLKQENERRHLAFLVDDWCAWALK